MEVWTSLIFLLHSQYYFHYVSVVKQIWLAASKSLKLKAASIASAKFIPKWSSDKTGSANICFEVTNYYQCSGWYNSIYGCIPTLDHISLVAKKHCKALTSCIIQCFTELQRLGNAILEKGCWSEISYLESKAPIIFLKPATSTTLTGRQFLAIQCVLESLSSFFPFLNQTCAWFLKTVSVQMSLSVCVCMFVCVCARPWGY